MIAALALVPSAAGGVSPSATVSPTSGYPGVRLVSTYSFTPKGSCSSYHNAVTWSFGNAMNWATSPIPSSAGGVCTSSTPPTAPPGGDAPGSYQVCGMDTSVSTTSACSTYTIKSPPPTPIPRPSPSPIPPLGSPSPSPSPSEATGASTGTPTPTAPQASAPRGTTGSGGGVDALQPVGRTGGAIDWPWTGLLLLLVLMVVAWRFRSWLMGVFENVVVLGKSGADLETELLHHETSPPAEGATYTSTAFPASPTDNEAAANEPRGVRPADVSPPAEPESPTPDRDATRAAEAGDEETQPPQDS